MNAEQNMDDPSLPQDGQVNWASLRPWFILLVSGLIFSAVSSAIVIIFNYLHEIFPKYYMVIFAVILFSFLGVLFIIERRVFTIDSSNFEAITAARSNQKVNKWILWGWSVLIFVSSILIVILFKNSQIGTFDIFLCFFLYSLCVTHLGDYVKASLSRRN